MSLYRTLAIILGIVGTLLAIAAAAVFYGYIPTTFVNGYTAPEVGTFAVLAIAGAIGAEAAHVSEERKRR